MTANPQEGSERIYLSDNSYEYGEDITPQIANELLGYNTRNRPPRALRIKQFSSMIRRGEWKPELSSIIVFMIRNGPVVLADGQNRLTAIRDSGITVRSKVTWIEGTEEEYVKFMRMIDRQPPRSLRDVWGIEHPGTDRSRSVSALNALLLIDHVLIGGDRAFREMDGDEKMAYASTHMGEIEMLVEAAQAWRDTNKFECITSWLAGHLVCHRVSPVEATRFWLMACKHEFIPEHSPQRWAYETINKRGTILKATSVQQNPTEYLGPAHDYVKLWNAHCQGRLVKALRRDATFPKALRHPNEPTV